MVRNPFSELEIEPYIGTNIRRSNTRAKDS